MAARWIPRTTLFVLGAMMFIAPMTISSTVRAESVFVSVRNAVADALDASNETGGYVVGLLAIVVILFITAAGLGIQSGGTVDPFGIGVMALGGIAFVILVGWWPAWTAIFIAFAFIMMILSRKGGEGS